MGGGPIAGETDMDCSRKWLEGIVDVAPDNIDTCISDVSRSAQEVEIHPEVGEIIPLASDTANNVASDTTSSVALASQHQSDVLIQSRLTSVVATILLAVFGGLTIGYAMNITGGTTSMEGFLVTLSKAIHRRKVKATTNNFCTYLNIWLALFTSIPQVSFIPSIWVARALIQSWGRKPVLIIGYILLLVGSIFMAWLPNDVVAVVGLFIIGCSMSFLRQVIRVICRELNVGRMQGCISLLFSVMMQYGNTLAKGINLSTSYNFRSGWRWSFGCCGLFAIPLIPLSLFLTETPRFLIEKGRMDEARVALRRIRRSAVEAEFQDLAASIEREDKRQWRRLSHSPLLMVNIAAQLIQKFIGLDSILFFGPLVLQSIGYSYQASFIAPFIATVIRAGVTGLTDLTYTYFGRRRTLICTCVGMFLAQVCLLGVFLDGVDLIFHMSARSSYIATTFAIPLVGFYSLLDGPSDWTTESHPERTKLLGTSLEMTASTFMSLIMNPAMTWIICSMKVWVFAFFAVVILCVGWLIYIFLPEGAGERDGGPNEDMWRGHWFWRRFLPEEDRDEIV
ncbi:sugar transport protein 8-like [Solanum stenotomum]|uniref:sugar transport protein 8-like n=1 Tax=Solanum stenotomum TaxID=172797 RepID=UPI0020D1802E|nr:sugar transport protein 8-like [Solanum stenotomum]